jgi:hypothetical protein
MPPELISAFSKFSKQESIVFLWTNYEQKEEFQKTIPSTKI